MGFVGESLTAKIGRRSNAENVANLVNRRNMIVRVECEEPARRKRLEAKPEAWLKHYLGTTYTRPFEKPHKQIISGCIEAHETSGRFIVAAERGIGKSAVLWGMILYLKLSGKRKFPACVPWADKALKRAFRFWKNALCFNKLLLADYPEYCQPFAHSKGIAQRVPNVWWEDTGELTGAQLTVGEGMIILTDQLGALGGSTINGNIRGLNHPQPDGTVLRPDIVLLDDVQDRGTAKSPVQVADTIAIIDGDVAGCGEVGRDMPMLMACNCIQIGDVSEHYLQSPEWNALKVPCIERWPDGWDDKHSKIKALWEDLHEKLMGDSGAVAFYKKHKKDITKGMILSAPAAFKGAEKCPDAFYGVIRMYFRMGEEAFMAERQQSPIDPVAQSGIYTLNPEIIMAKATQRKPLEVPEWVTSIIASTDINPSYALSTVVIGMGQDQTAALLWYGLHKLSISGDVSAAELARQLYAELAIHGKNLSQLPARPTFWGIDAGGAQFDPVIKFAEMAPQLCGIPAMGFTGRGARNYKPYGKTLVPAQRREQCHGCLDRKQGRVIRWVAWNADYWKECAQRAWLGEIGQPGSISLPEGKHSEIAHQICADKLLGKGEIGGQMIWNFTRVPGRNDFGDAMAQGYAVHAFQGIGTGGGVAAKRQRRRPSGVTVISM
jgi:hypothetical protein